jgi:hypothetical protein
LRADPVTWAATSKTAIAITGDIVVDDYSITFANGKSLAIEPYEAGRVWDWSGSGKNVAGDVFTADSSANPKLLNGNKLCATSVTHVVIWSPGEGELGINVYSGSKRERSGRWAWGLDIGLNTRGGGQLPKLRSWRLVSVSSCFSRLGPRMPTAMSLLAARIRTISKTHS